MEKYTIRQGETGLFDIEVLDENGVAIDLTGSNTTNVIVNLVNKNVSMAKFSLKDMGADFDHLSVALNVITIEVTREKSKLYNTGITKAVVTIEQTDSVLGSSFYDFEVADFLSVVYSDNAEIILN